MRQDEMSVLLVDDDPHVCAIFELVMKHHKLPLKIMGDAESALSYLMSNTPDVVVMDIFLPGIDGYQALERIRKNALAPGCRIVATTAYHTNDTQQEVVKRGFDGYLEKPFAADTIVPYLQSVVGQS